MKDKIIKNITTILGVCILFINTTPIFAQILEIQIIGAGYKVLTPTQLNFPIINTGTENTTTNIKTRNVFLEKDKSNQNRYGFQVIDENGGNPFDVLITTDEFKISETTKTIQGSNNKILKVASTEFFEIGNKILIPSVFNNTEFTINTINHPDTIEIAENEDLSIVPDNTNIIKIINCNDSPKKCISLNNFSIKNSDGINPEFNTLNGNENDLQLHSSTDSFITFKGKAITTTGSINQILNVENTNNLFVGEEIIFPSDSGVNPLTNKITEISSPTSFKVETSFIDPPTDGIELYSKNIRTLTLANSTGEEPGIFEIYPVLQLVVPAGQKNGLYQTTLNLTIL